jgi:anaerobic magnesium-protoporphyrin IX monomethyl ester cyclase
MPLGLVYLAGAARQAGLIAEIYDAMAKDHGYPEVEARLRDSTADYVATTAITATINDAIKVLELVKGVNPAIITILGGVHPTFMYEEVLASSDAIDYIVIGEGENTLRHLLAVLDEGGEPSTVPGIAFRHGSSVVTTEKRRFVEDIDTLPAAWDLLEWSDYTYYIIPDSRLGAISTSRGCDQGCRFCSQQKFWERSWRARLPEKVAGELEYLYATYDVNVFLITDEYPTRSRERWEALLDLLIARQLPVYLLMETRAPDIIRDRDILWKYRKAGIVHIAIGIETTDPVTLDAIKKGTSLDEFKEALKLIHGEGIVSDVSFMLGFPDETQADIQRVMQFVRECNPDNASFLALTPWPYSDMFADLRQYIRVHDYAKYNLVDPVIEPEKMSLQQIDVAIVDCFRKFYMGKIIDVMTMKDDFKRGYLLRAAKLFMGSSFIVKKLGIGIISKIPSKLGEMMRSK